MSTAIEEVVSSTEEKPESIIFQVFIGFRKPDGGITLLVGDGTNDCGVYAALAKIFNRTPWEIFSAISAHVQQSGSGLMQEYTKKDDAAMAVTQASLFANQARCVCFLRQEAYFYIKETKPNM